MPCIVIDPGHGATQNTDDFRVGPTGEREEWINLRVSLLLAELISNSDHEVHLTRRKDVNLSLNERVEMTLDLGADLFLSIHHNSSSPVDPDVDYPLVFSRGDLNCNSREQRLAQILAEEFVHCRKQDGQIFSDQLIFDEGLGLLRGLENKVPAVIGEFSFFSHPAEEQRLKSEDHCQKEAQCYLNTIDRFFAETDSFEDNQFLTLIDRNLRQSLEDFKSSPKSWSAHYQAGVAEFEQENWQSSAEELQCSIALFINHPFSYLAFDMIAKCYENMNEIKQSEKFQKMVEHGVRPLFFERMDS